MSRSSVAGWYYFDVPLVIAGPYYVIADDGPCEDKYARVEGRYSMGVAVDPSPYPAPVASTGSIPLILEGQTNASIADDLILGTRLRAGTPAFMGWPFRAGVPAHVGISLWGKAAACGDGSFARMDLQVYAPYVNVSWIEGTL